MDREVVWSHSATTDLESIVEHIFRDSEFYAATVARELASAARSLATFPSVAEWCPSTKTPLSEKSSLGVTVLSIGCGQTGWKC